jgi:hypothetical protein
MSQEREDYADRDQPRRRAAGSPQLWRRLHLRPFLVPAIAVLVLVTFGVGYFVGAVTESRQQQRAKFRRDAAAIAPVLAADPAFGRVEVRGRDGGGILLAGEVATPADGARLRAAFVRLFGEPDVWRIETVVKQTGKPVAALGGDSSSAP